MDQIMEYLYISGCGVVTDENLRKFQITCIIDATNFGNRPMKNIETVKVPMEDEESAQLIDYFDRVGDKIKSIRENHGKTLVHCAAGVSRSATLCIAYLVKHENLTLEQAYRRVFEKRSIISPNPGFWKQLIQYEKRLRGGESSVTMVTRAYDEVPDLYIKNVSQL